MRECKFCQTPFDESLAWNGSKRGHGPSRQFCSTTCKGRQNNPPGSQRNAHLKFLYGISITEYDQLLEAQDFRCAICGATEVEVLNTSGRRLHVDHNHETGYVRGLLCSPCNIGIGCFRENPVLFAQAVVYMKSSSG